MKVVDILMITAKKRKGAILGYDAVNFLIVFTIFLSLGAYGFTQYLDNAKRSSAKNQIASIVSAVSHYHYDMDAYPASLSVLTGKSGNLGPWLASLPNDPWGMSYQYAVSSDGKRFVVYSTCGQNGVTVNANTVVAIGQTTAVFAYGQ